MPTGKSRGHSTAGTEGQSTVGLPSVPAWSQGPERSRPQGYSQHSMGLEAAYRDTILPLGSGMCTRKTRRTRVFLRPMSVSPLRSSMSALRSFRIPAQSMLQHTQP